MSELTKEIRLWSDAAMGQHDKNVLALCDEHERLEAEHARLLKNWQKSLEMLESARTEHARVCNEHALLVQESGREGRELDRLEGLLRAWGEANMVSNEDRNSETLTAALAAFQNAYAEAVRLAKEKP